jgi:hypothetical protein
MLVGQPEAQVRRGARDEAVADARVHAVTPGGMVESESGAGAGKGGRSSDGDRKNVPLQKHLPTSFAG